MKNWEYQPGYLKTIPIPISTKTYTPVSHSVFIDEIKEELDINNYTIKKEEYLCCNDGKIMTGKYTIDNENSLFNPAIFFTNSYNKMRKAELTSGLLVLLCSNGMIGLDGNKFSKKHSGTVLSELRNSIKLGIATMEEQFERLVKNIEEMKAIILTDDVICTFIGDMYMNEDMITDNQLSIFKKERKHSKDFKTNSLWDVYNNVTESYKNTHPMYFDKQHLKFHSYVSDRFSLTGSRKLFKKPQLLIT